MSNLSGASVSPSSLPLSGKTCSIASLGCPKNLVDSETMIGRLTAVGFQMTEDADRVDLFVLNTCGFLRSARAEAEDYIEQALEQKADGNIVRLFVTGCVVATDGKELAEKYPEVDAWLSPYDEAKIADLALELFKGEEDTSEKVAAPRFYYEPTRALTLDDSTRTRLTLPHIAYLKIADGCDRFCSYCAIPKIRGRYVSKPYETILDEASRLADSGVRELVLVAQETTFWGNDLYGKPDLKRLLAALKDKNQFDWIRVLYTYPLFWDSELTSLFKMEEPGKTSILPYVDVPLQHCNSELLKKMNRRVDKTQTEELIAKLREEIPDVVLRSSFIVGFPGETDANYQELVDFVEKMQFERAGVFEYSAEPGTPAAELEGQVPAEIKARRWERLSAKQERLSRRFARSFIGKTVDVMIDSRVVSDAGAVMRNACIGRTRADAPDVDPVVYVTGRDLELGVLTPCEIVDAQGLDLIAVPTDPEKLFVSKDERRMTAEREEASVVQIKTGARPKKAPRPKSANPKKAPRPKSANPKNKGRGGERRRYGKGDSRRD